MGLYREAALPEIGSRALRTDSAPDQFGMNDSAPHGGLLFFDDLRNPRLVGDIDRATFCDVVLDLRADRKAGPERQRQRQQNTRSQQQAALVASQKFDFT